MNRTIRVNPIKFALLITLAACAAPEPPPAQKMNLGGYSTQFKDGYNDGCGSARSSTRERNESRYRKDTDYMMGWNDGYSVCSRR